MSSNLMAEIRDPSGRPYEPWEQPFSTGKVRVEIEVGRVGDCFVPVAGGDEVVWAVFKGMTYGEYSRIDADCTTAYVSVRNRMELIRDLQEMRRQIVRRMLLEWSLPISLDRDMETGWLTDESFGCVCRLPGPLVTGLVHKYEISLDMTKKEAAVIDRQCALLFGKNARGVENPCEAVMLYCSMSNFWDEFGLSRKDLEELPYLDYIRLKVMLNQKGVHISRQSKASDSSVPKAKIAGAGGKVRPSRGKVVRMP